MKLEFPPDLRPYGLYIAGNPGQGKTSLIQRLALGDIQAGRGVCVIDPTGDLVNELVHHVPKFRVNDTIWFDSTNPPSIDFFSYHDAAEREVLTDMLIKIFDLAEAKRQGPYLYQVLCILFDYNDTKPVHPATLLDIANFIEKERYREYVIYKECPHLRWEHMPKPSEFDAVLSRLIKYQQSKSLKQCLASPSPQINIWDVMQKNKVFLVNLQDTPSAHFLGALISAKFQQATFRRRIIDPNKRVPYYLYVDECNTVMKFAAEDFDAIMLRARKYKLCLTMSNQIPTKLPKEIKESLGTIGSLILLQLSPKDAHIFKDHIQPYEPKHLINLEKFHAIARVGNKVYRVHTPMYLGVSTASYAPTIKNRTKPEPPSQPPQEWFNEEDGNRRTKSETINDQKAPNPAFHGREKKKS